jgi:predicted permease
MRPDQGLRAGVRRLLRVASSSRAAIVAEADDEWESVLTARIDDLVAHGWSPDAARREALARMGATDAAALARTRQHHHRSALRRERRLRLTEQLERVKFDVTFALRQLRRAPAFALVAVLTLAVGVGANTAIFTIVDAVLLRPLPVPAPNELIAVGNPTSINGHTTGAPRGDLISYPLYRVLRDDSSLVTGLAASGTTGRLDVRVDGRSEFEHPNGRFVSGNYFTVLRVRPEIGRVFDAADGGAIGGSPVAVISDAYWRGRFGATPEILGRRIRVGASELTIIGVAERGFTGDVAEQPTALWLPITMQPLIQPHAASIEHWDTSWLLLLGRLRPGVDIPEAEAAFTTLIRSALVARATTPAEAARYRREPTVITSGARGFSAVRRSFRSGLLTLEIGGTVLLLIVCTNLATLLLARAVARGPEMAVRSALGAGRRRLVRQLATESAVLAVLGAVMGVVLAWWGSSAVVAAATPNDNQRIAATIDGRVLLFTVGLTIVAAFCFGVLPALRVARADLTATMRGGSRSVLSASGGGRIPIGRVLVPIQTVMSLVLLSATALLARSLVNVQQRDPGLDRDHLLVIPVGAGERGIVGERFIALATRLRDRIQRVPGVRAVTYSENGLFLGHDGSAVVSIPGFTGRTAEDSSLFYDFVGPGYAHAIGAHVLRGRDLEPSDGPAAVGVCVLNESAERFYFGGASAVGRSIYFDPAKPTIVVGIIADVRDRSLTSPPRRRAYAPYAQQVADEDHPALTLEIRTVGDPAPVAPSIRRVIAEVDSDLPIISIMPLSELMRQSLTEERLVVTLGAAFGLTALFLATLGLYGVMSYSVARRNGEMGLRIALGAERRDLIRLVMGEGLRLAVLGIAVGSPIVLLAARALRSQLQDVPTLDPISIGGAVLVLLTFALVAALIPALRAARVAPTRALNAS